MSGNNLEQALLSMGATSLLGLKHELHLRRYSTSKLEDAVDSALVARSKSRASLEDREGAGSNPDTRAILDGPRQPSTGSAEFLQELGARDSAVSINVDH